MDGGTVLGKQGILDATTMDLNAGNCGAAINVISPLYNSGNSDNNVRLMAASAFGCDAGVNIFQMIDHMDSDSGTLTSGGFFAFLAQIFYGISGNFSVAGSYAAVDALQAILLPGALVLTSDQVNSGTDNPGSVWVCDRMQDSTTYLLFVSMAMIGAIENQIPSVVSGTSIDSTTFDLTGGTLPWTSATAAGMATDTTGRGITGCAYASAILNLSDSMNGVPGKCSGMCGSFTGSLQTSCTKMASALSASSLDAACSLGCLACGITCPTDPVTGSAGCPITLRDRNNCTGAASDANSCAAAGIITLINSKAPAGWHS